MISSTCVPCTWCSQGKALEQRGFRLLDVLPVRCEFISCADFARRLLHGLCGKFRHDRGKRLQTAQLRACEAVASAGIGADALIAGRVDVAAAALLVPATGNRRSTCSSPAVSAILMMA